MIRLRFSLKDRDQIFFEGSESDCLVYLLKGIREYHSLSGTISCRIFDNTEEREGQEKMRHEEEREKRK